MKKPCLIAAWLFLLCIVGGCARIAGPNWFHPDTATRQQNRALRYDPYPENEPGPPMGVRPREYQNPPPETSRARWTLGNWGQ